MVNIWLNKEVWFNEDKKLKDLSLEEYAKVNPLKYEEKETVSARNLPSVVFGALRHLVRTGHFHSISEAERVATFLGVIKMRYDSDIERLVIHIDKLYDEYHGHDHERNIKYATRLKGRKSNVSVTKRTRGMCGDLAGKLDLPLSKVTGIALIRGLAVSVEWVRERDLNVFEFELDEFKLGMKASLGIIKDKAKDDGSEDGNATESKAQETGEGATGE